MDRRTFVGTLAGGADENANSLVLRVDYGADAALLGGDCVTEGCEDAFDPGAIGLYEVHHHGGDDASSEALLAQMEPDQAMIPADGPPDPAVLARLAAHGGEVFRTDLDGAIHAESEGLGFTVATER